MATGDSTAPTDDGRQSKPAYLRRFGRLSRSAANTHANPDAAHQPLTLRQQELLSHFSEMTKAQQGSFFRKIVRMRNA